MPFEPSLDPPDDFWDNDSELTEEEKDDLKRQEIWEKLQEERWPELPSNYTPKQREWRD